MSLRVVVLASGAGSNLSALLDAERTRRVAYEVVAVGSDRPSSKALTLAAAAAKRTFAVPFKSGGERSLWDKALADAVMAEGPDLLVLAGFMRILGRALIDRLPRRIINVHPSLLPAFPGLAAPAQALAAGAHITGCTVHLVDAGVDTGPILAQAAVPVMRDDSPETLHNRIREQEHTVLPIVVDLWARKALEQGCPFPSDPLTVVWGPDNAD